MKVLATYFGFASSRHFHIQILHATVITTQSKLFVEQCEFLFVVRCVSVHKKC